ncbi:hypothetical protein JVT61DRAFT_14193 [Boletus reticuloceps]|uniref:Uncharacterized protein n=1 Tax=Boletus reticuloceps TaxID=495285 RepID=A0A8I2YD21_9AGAM|nr:hypothetical protein JVT61DRAFT_14193 [Boletus reticuloceps]
MTDGPKQIERQIGKLKQDSARDVERQLAQQRVGAKEAKIREVRLCLRDYESRYRLSMLTAFTWWYGV